MKQHQSQTEARGTAPGVSRSYSQLKDPLTTSTSSWPGKSISIQKGGHRARTLLQAGFLLLSGLAAVIAVSLLTWRFSMPPLLLQGTQQQWEEPLDLTMEDSVRRIWAFSHNDEMQGDNALTLALSLGFGAVEVDTWLGPSGAGSSIDSSSSLAGSESPESDLTLLVGHEPQDVEQSRTLKRIYLDPLMAILDEHNPGGVSDKNWTGLYRDDPRAEVTLAIDMKSDGPQTWPYLVSALQPFLAKGYLTTYAPSTSTWTRGPLRIIGTGNTPLPYVYYQSPLRYIFWDADLNSVSSQITIPATPAGPAVKITLDNTIAPMASAKFPIVWHAGAVLPAWKALNPILQRMEAYATAANQRGIEARWWGAARAPGLLRRQIWDMCRRTGAAWINADDLVDAADWLARQ